MTGATVSSPTDAPAPAAPVPGGRLAGAAPDRPAPTLVERFRRLPSANIADAMGRLGAMDPGIKPAWPGATMVGPAFTVWTRPGDNRGIHEALQQVRPGDVIVVNGGGDQARALIGELVAGRAKIRAVGGFVIDGAVRDAEGLAEYDMPVFARSRTPSGPYKDGPFALSIDIAVGGVAVHPGDIVVGDPDGVVVVPLQSAEAIAEAAEAKQAKELATREWIDQSLTAATDGAEVRS
ncbi:RraA family protein [Brachybacterium sp. P6-10-X1]|uniref:RraA family protein n=1 Tax=Brachybacterium sp. P6-10-X1 TaxID=1903186 RepID=UPI000976AA89|nr:methyltransferase [Brachybacterium sp. P6-10-X1]